MSAEMQFEGKLVYASRAAADEARERVRELLAEDDEDLRRIVAEDPSFMRIVDETIAVSISLSGPSHWWFSFEGLVETLAETAETGFVDGVLEGAEGKIRYHAGGEEEELD
jgi:hypothetical protein